MKKPTSPFRWDEDLIEWLKKQATKVNRSLANYCETVLKEHRARISKNKSRKK